MIAEIRLNKRNKTIKIVNRRNSIRLTHTGKRGPEGLKGDKGDKGDQGDKGDTGVSTFVRVHHGTDPSIDRPDALYVEWVGSVAPNNATSQDTWIDTN